MNPIKKLAFPLILMAMCLVTLVGATTILDPNYVYTSGSLNGTSAQILGPLTCTTLDTGQGAYELYAMNQNLRTTDAPTFATVNTGQGANELYDMNQNVQTTDAPTFATVNTGQGANELYDMDQNMMTSSDVEFNSLTFTEIISPIGLDTTYYIGRNGANSILIQASNREVLADSSAYNVWRWALGNLSATGGKIIFAGDQNIGANQLIVTNNGGWGDYDLIIEGLGRGNSILRRTGTGTLLNLTSCNLKIRDCSLRTADGNVIYGTETFTNIAHCEITCGTWLDTGWAIHFIDSSFCELENNMIQSYGDGIVWIETLLTGGYNFGTVKIRGENMWWMYTPGAIGLKLTGTSTYQTESVTVSGTIEILASTGATLADNYTAVYMDYAWNNQILNVKYERCATGYLVKHSRYNIIDQMYQNNNYFNGMTVFDFRTGALNNHVLHYKAAYRGDSNVTLISDISSSLNNPNVFEGFTMGSITAPGEWTCSITDYTAILWMGGDMSSENLYGQNGAVNYNFPAAATTYSFEHHCARAPTTVTITWNERVVEDWWITANSTKITINLFDASEQIYTFDWACSINKQGIG